MSFLFSVIALAILSLAQRWSSLTAVLAGFVCLIFLLEILVSYGTKKPPGLEWVTSAAYYPNPEPRWIVSALTILVAILFLLWYRRVRSLLWGIPIAAAGFAVLYSATLWANQNDFMISTKRAPETFHLADRKMPKGPQTDTQRLYENIQLTGLGRGAFLEPVRIIADGRERYLHKLDNNYYAGVVKGFYRDQALGRHFVGKGDLFRSHGNNIIFSYSYAGIAEAPQLDFTKTIQKAHDDQSISRVKVRGEAKKWQLVHEMALQDGTFQSKFDISGRLNIEGTKADPGRRNYVLTLYQPRLGFSSDPKMSHHTFGWGRIQDCQIVIFHEKLGECILPGTQNVKAGSVGNIFGSIEENTRKFEIPTNDAWEILWPEGDATEQWLEGARLQIYTTKYVGRFEDVLVLAKE